MRQKIHTYYILYTLNTIEHHYSGNKNRRYNDIRMVFYWFIFIEFLDIRWTSGRVIIQWLHIISINNFIMSCFTFCWCHFSINITFYLRFRIKLLCLLKFGMLLLYCKSNCEESICNSSKQPAESGAVELVSFCAGHPHGQYPASLLFHSYF